MSWPRRGELGGAASSMRARRVRLNRDVHAINCALRCAREREELSSVAGQPDARTRARGRRDRCMHTDSPQSKTQIRCQRRPHIHSAHCGSLWPIPWRAKRTSAAHQRAGVDGSQRPRKLVVPERGADDRRALKTLRGADVISRSGGTAYAARHVESTSRG